MSVTHRDITITYIKMLSDPQYNGNLAPLRIL